MTREEAMRMDKLELLTRIKAEYTERLPTMDRIEIVYPNGQRSAVGNPRCLKVIREALVKELDAQIAEEKLMRGIAC